MDRTTANNLTRKLLDEHDLKNWHVRISSDPNQPFLGLCMYRDKTIVLNAFHCDIHPYDEVVDTIKHEVAHALTPGHGHDDVWAAKAREIGCTNTLPCSHLNIPEHVLDAIRSSQLVEMTVEEEVHVIRRPKYTVTRLQDKCPDCGKVAVEKFSIESVDAKTGDTIKLITLECFHIIKKVIPRGTPFETMVSNDWKPEIKACKHEWPSIDKVKAEHIPSNRCLKCGEYKLYNFQVIGARLAEAGLAMQKGFGIFDDMGLGKTIQALALLKFHSDKLTPCMVVTKSAIKYPWFKKAVEWLGPEYIAQIISTSRDYLFPGLKLYIIPYDLLRRFPREKLHALGIKLVILDECQQIKNPDSSRTQETRKLVSANPDCKVLPLSGTPWKNRGGEFFPVLNMMDPIKFSSYQGYLDRWVDFYFQGNRRKMGGIRNPEKFREFVASLLIRREYEEVMEEFPSTNRMKLNVHLDEMAQDAYDDSEDQFVDWYNQLVLDGKEVNGMEILAKMARMRHLTGLAKIPATLNFVETFVEETSRKLVIFVHHKDVGQMMYGSLVNTDKATNKDYAELAQTLKDEGVEILSYTSEHTGKPAGFEIERKFNTARRAIMVASTLACGEGLDLQTCADTVMHERQWNPQNEDQAAPGRFRRIGQEAKQINITFPEAEGTVDEHLDGIVERKRRDYHVVMNKGETPRWSEDDIAKELADIIVKRHREKKRKNQKRA